MTKQDETQGGEGTITTLSVVGGGVQVEHVNHEEVRRRVQDLKARVEQDGWDLSVALWEVYQGALYQAWGYESWADYVERELEFKLRKAQYYVAVQEWVRVFAPDFVEWVKTCGLSKARLMSGRILPEEAQLWRNRLDGKTYREMEAILSGQDPDDQGGGSGGGGDGDDGGDGDGAGSTRVKALHINLAPEQRANVDAAIAQAKQQAETDSDAHAIDLICTAFRSSEGHYRAKEEHLVAVERVLGLKIAAFKPLSDGRAKVVYGQEFLDKMLEEVSEDEEAASGNSEA
jgi:hypothetical protein